MKKIVFRKEYISKLFAYKDHDLIKVVSGLRRSGKSTLFESYRLELIKSGISPSQIVFLNFEDFELRKYLSDLDALYQYIISGLDATQPSYVFLDEIQNVREFERLVDGLFIKPNIDVYITGSNAFLLSGELATLLSGRYIEISILPFSFKEYLTARNVDYGNSYLNFEALFFDYVNETSLPKGTDLRESGLDSIMSYLEAIYKTIVEKDITQRYKIYHKTTFEDVTKFMASSIGSPVAAGNIAKILKNKGEKTHNTTVERYLDHLVASYVFYKVPRFDIKGKKLLTTQKKYYLVDLGLLHILIGKDRTTDRGHMLENIVYLELVRRGYKVWTGIGRNYEVDFVCKNPSGDIEYYQVAWQLSTEATIEREFFALEKIRDNYPKILLSADSYTLSRNGIKHLNVFNWLLDRSI